LFFQAPICASFMKSPAHPNSRGSGGLNIAPWLTKTRQSG
jgi:hypothetical protein